MRVASIVCAADSTTPSDEAPPTRVRAPDKHTLLAFYTGARRLIRSSRRVYARFVGTLDLDELLGGVRVVEILRAEASAHGDVACQHAHTSAEHEAVLLAPVPLRHQPVTQPQKPHCMGGKGLGTATLVSIDGDRRLLSAKQAGFPLHVSRRSREGTRRPIDVCSTVPYRGAKFYSVRDMLS